MKEKNFIKKLKKLHIGEKLVIPVYYGLDSKDNVVFDYESMQEEFENKLKEIWDLLQEKDELTDIVEEKIDKINSDRAEQKE